VGALIIIGWALASRQTTNAGAFFGAGTLLLIAGLGFVSVWLGKLARKTGAAHFTLGELAMRGCGRRRARSLTTIALLASGCFIVAAVGVFRLEADLDASRSSGTGGFALIGESTLPVVQDLNTEAGQEFYGLSKGQTEGISFVQFRMREGDDASCLNLNRAQQPRLLGVKPESLAGRFSFADVASGLDKSKGWSLLSSDQHREPLCECSSAEIIPAIGDANSIEWALGKKLGDTIDYTDDAGRTVQLRLVGAVANSILQGSLIIDEAEFVKHFPSQTGYRWFLIDAPSGTASSRRSVELQLGAKPTNSISAISSTLSRALQDAGLELTPATVRLNAFNAVQNTYLGTFQVLGGLGLLLGSAGLGVVVLRNVLERRGELGLLVAVGFRRRALRRLVLGEHAALLLLGLALGIFAAAVAVLPSILSSAGQLPHLSLALTLIGVVLNGLAWTWLATRAALRGNLLVALRNE
jgi:hypothetical protein